MSKLTNEETTQWYAQNRGLYKKLSTKVHNILLELLEEENITVHAINDRTKTLDSFRTKIDSPKYDDAVNQITDLSGIRIIAYVEDDLKPICKVIEAAFHIDSDNSLDKSDELGTDRVGYRSIHYIARIKDDRLILPEYKKFKDLKFEIQVRTILQHAWAEIEHDKNYKFNGVLPPEIRRRFKILAGTLELVDREFNKLSAEIDNISRSVTIAEEEDKLSTIELNSTTLKQFLTNRFKILIDEDLLTPSLYKDDVILKELDDFGIKNLKDLNDIIPADIDDSYRQLPNANENNSFLGLLRDLMILKDAEQYFNKAWNENWSVLDFSAATLYKSHNIDVDDISNRYKTLVM